MLLVDPQKCRLWLPVNLSILASVLLLCAHVANAGNRYPVSAVAAAVAVASPIITPVSTTVFTPVFTPVFTTDTFFSPTHAEFVFSESETPPVKPGTGWLKVAFPHDWPTDAPRLGWYRITLPELAYNEPKAAYLWRLTMNAEIWLNDELIGSGGRLNEPVTRNWNHPLIFTLPKRAWRDEGNLLYIRLATYPGWGDLAGVVIGPETTLRETQSNRYFWQVNVSQATFVVSLVALLISITLWVVSRSMVYLTFAITCASCAVWVSNLFITVAPLSEFLWSALVHAALDWYGISLVLFCHALLGIDAARRNLAVLFYGAAATLAYGSMSLPQLFQYNPAIHSVTILTSIYVVVMAIRYAYKLKQQEVVAFALCMFVTVAFAIHDLAIDASRAGNEWQDNVYLLHFATPVLMLIMIAILSGQFAASLRRVAEADRRIRSEREQLYADIHDDIGSRVLSLVYSAESSEQADLARETLEEVRSIVRGATGKFDSLTTLLDECEIEARERSLLADKDLVWTCHLEAIPKNQQLPDRHYYHIQRIFRELISNALKHADTDKIEVSIEYDGHDRQAPDHLRISLRDYGKGQGNGPFTPGTGMASIQRRVNHMSGKVSWRPAHPGTVCLVELPLEADASQML